MNGLKVIIVGAGIGGLASGILLRNAGFEVEIYERAPELRPLGAGICMWPNGAKAVNGLGLGPAMERVSPPLNAVHYRSKNGELLTEIPLGDLEAVSGTRSYPLARADLHLALLEELDATRVHLNRECVGVEQNASSATALFCDGTSATGDLIVGADGVKSVVREHVAGVRPLRYLYSSWLGIVPDDCGLSAADVFTFHLGYPQRTGVLPVSGHRMYYFFDAPVEENWTAAGGPRAELSELFAGWARPLASLIGRLDDECVTRVTVNDVEPLGSYVRDRVALIGDAAHAIPPTLGQGGALAMEDAFVLTRYLLTTTVSIGDALRRYDSTRRQRVEPVVLASRARADSTVRGTADAAEQRDQMAHHASIPESFVEALAMIANTGPLG